MCFLRVSEYEINHVFLEVTANFCGLDLVVSKIYCNFATAFERKSY